MSAPDRDAVEWEALADLIAEKRDAYPRLAGGMDSEELADAILAAGWSRSPRPAAVSEEAVEAAERAMDRLANDFGSGRTNTSPTNRNCARAALTAALPLLAPGQSEAEVRDLSSLRDPLARALYLEQAAGHVHPDDELTPEQRWEQGFDFKHLWAQKADRLLARIAPAEDGAE